MRTTARHRHLVALVVMAAIAALALPTVATAGTVERGEDELTIGYVVAGDRNDNGFYEGQVKSVTKTAKKQDMKTIVVDKVNPGAAQEAFENLCRQDVDVIIGGGSELTDGFVPVSLSPECEDILFLLVAGFPPTEDSFATVGANENEAHYMGGYAAGLLLEQNGGDVACVVGGPDLPFVRAMEANMTAGLQAATPDKEMLVTLTGDFEDAALATEALRAQIDRGCTLFYPYLGGALPAAVDAAAEADIGVMSTSVDLCGEAPFIQESILYNPALYLPTVVKAINNDKVEEGEQFALYGVGDNKKIGIKNPNNGVGAKLCDPTPEQQDQLDEIREGIISGEIDTGQAG
jgi:basic membrane lipoprotein Med (substrate-binding protein (PBP1-ABC) superfamily)